MNPGSNEIAGAGTATEALRLEVERCRRELDECRKRTAELEQAEALLAGEKRILEMVARGSALPEILSALCRQIEEMSGGSDWTGSAMDRRSYGLRSDAANHEFLMGRPPRRSQPVRCVV